jgi:hypothetical protein
MLRRLSSPLFPIRLSYSSYQLCRPNLLHWKAWQQNEVCICIILGSLNTELAVKYVTVVHNCWGIYEILPNCRCQKDNLKQFSYLGPTVLEWPVKRHCYLTFSVWSMWTDTRVVGVTVQNLSSRSARDPALCNLVLTHHEFTHIVFFF